MASGGLFIGAREVPGGFQRRLAVAAAVVSAAFVFLGGRLWYLQVARGHEMRVRSENNRIRPVRQPAPRGVVYDRHGEILIDNRPSFDAIFVPEDVPDDGHVLTSLARYLGENVPALHERLRAPSRRHPYEGVALSRDVDWQGVVALETHQLELPGVFLQVAPKRYYPFGPLASHLLGYVGEVNEEELTQGSCAYRPGDLRGKAGVESMWDNALCGRAGGQQVEVDALSRRVRVLDEVGGIPGNSIVMTLDRDLQETAERALGEAEGAVVALDPRNGELLVMVSHPEYDPNVFARGIRRAEWLALVEDPLHPMHNRAVKGQYPPGSTFKIAVASAALNEGLIGPGDGVTCLGGLWFGGHNFRCWRRGGHGAVNLHRAIVESCDVFFYRIGQRLGVDRIADYARRLGLGDPTGIALDHEKGGTVPDSVWKRRNFDAPWYPGETLSVAIGQGYVTATPLQMAVLAATVANGGVRYRPRYMKRIERPDGSVVQEFEPEVLGNAHLNEATLTRVRAAMRDVVMAPNGTGRRAQVDGVEVAGKTGTSQTMGAAALARSRPGDRATRDHAWFISFAPVGAPEIAISVLVEHAGEGGGKVAAPVAQQVLDRYFTRGNRPTTESPTREAHAAGPPPDRPL